MKIPLTDVMCVTALSSDQNSLKRQCRLTVFLSIRILLKYAMGLTVLSLDQNSFKRRYWLNSIVL